MKEVTVKGAKVIQRVDRQLIIPSKAMVSSSADGYDLLKKMTLPGIEVNTLERTITSRQGGGVQVRINGVKATTQDILALRPDEVTKVEYIGNNQLAKETGKPDLYLYNKISATNSTPSFDLYFSKQFARSLTLEYYIT